MPAYTGSFINFFDTFKEYMADGTIDMDDDVFKVVLVASANAPVATNTILSNITQISSAGGYAPVTLANTTWVNASGTITFDGDDTAFSASGADFDAARYWVVYDDTATVAVDALVAWGYIDATPADVTVTDGTTLTIQWNAGGVFTLA